MNGNSEGNQRSTPLVDNRYILDQITREISVEHTLISHRMTWLVTSQAFLVAAFAVSGYRQNTLHFFFAWAVPLVGLCVAALAHLAIQAAVKVQEGLLKVQREFLEQLLTRTDITEPEKSLLHLFARTTVLERCTGDSTHRSALYGPRFIPLIFCVFWAVVLYLNSVDALKSFDSIINRSAVTNTTNGRPAPYDSL